ncbi:GRB10-interacting GYF protein 2 [Cloeon dipterum]|uniref:GRB10-interacting GYF protein 2 n=1 Tax=Cloeon dipterum TaxID=197152 RepID=UPI0032207BBF
MTDSLKFGPEWLRNLTQPSDSSGGLGGGPTSTAHRYQLAEYRYGREEMLAIFGSKKPSVPDWQDIFPMLFLDKPLPPLALTQMTEEETRMWQRGINSEVVVRSTGYGRGSGPIPIGGRGLPLQNSSNYGPGVGRGRARFSNGRGRFEEDTPREPGGSGFPVNNYASRGRFDRSVSGPERTWTEKAENGAEWSGGSVSPRRELKPFFGKPPIDNWRNNSIDGEEGTQGRRPSGGTGIKWNRPSSWRNESGGKDRESDWHGEGEHGKDLGFKYSDAQENDKVDKRIDPNFKFLDAIKETKEMQRRRELLVKELDELDKKVKFYEEQENSGSCPVIDYAECFTRKHTIQSEIKKSVELEQALIDKIRHHLAVNPKDGEMGDSGLRRHHDSDLPEWATMNAADEGGSFDDSGAYHGGVFYCEDGPERESPSQTSKHSSELSPERANEGHKNLRNKEGDRREEPKLPKQVSHVKPLIPQFEQEQSSFKKHESVKEQQQSVNILPLIMGEKSISNEKWPEKMVDDVIKDEVVKIAEEVIQPPAKEEFWFYLDPQGFEQGKFSTEQMLAWTKSGFFPHNLQVRRDSDNFFSDICRFSAIWEQASPVPDPVHTEIPLIPNALKSGSPTNNSSGKVFDSVRVAQAEIAMRQYEEAERIKLDRLAFESDEGYLSPEESFETKNYEKQMIWNELKKEKERRDMHNRMGGTFANYVPLDSSSAPSLKPTSAWISQWMQKQYAKLLNGKKRFLPEERELLILCKLHEKKLELDNKEKMVRVMPNLAPGDSWHLPPVPSVPESVWGSEPAAAPSPSRLVDSLWGDLEPIPMPQSVPTSLWSMSSPNGLPQARHQFTGQFDKVEADALELEKLAAEATSRRESHRREENLRIQKELEAAKKAIELKRLEEEKRLQEEAEKQRQELMIARQMEIELEKERLRLEQEIQKKKLEEEAAAAAAAAAAAMRQKMELEKKLAEEEEKRRETEEKEKKKAKNEPSISRAQEEALKKQQQLARKKELEMQSVQQVEAQQRQEQLRKQKELQLKQQQEQELQRQLEIQRQQEMRKHLELQQEQQRKKLAEAKAASAKASKVAPWMQQAAGIKNSVTSLAEIQKLQKEETQKEMAAVQEQRSKLQQQQQQSLFAEEHMRPWDGANQKIAQSMLNLQQIQEEQKKSRTELTVERPPPAVPAPVANPISNMWNSAWSQAPPQTSGIWGQSVTSKVIAKPVHSTQPAPQVSAMPASIWNADPEPAQSAPPAAQKTAPANTAAAKKKTSKNKSKKEEAQVMKIFESKKCSDDFTSWCVQSLSALDSDVDIDIPTFVNFLKDIESPFDINDYVRSYLGNGQEAREFAKNFIEKRSKWRNSQKKSVAADDLCKPAPAVNPMENDFLEVKGKVKKPKKKQMTKVDSRILGFSVTAAPDRLNVGDRDYGEQ